MVVLPDWKGERRLLPLWDIGYHFESEPMSSKFRNLRFRHLHTWLFAVTRMAWMRTNRVSLRSHFVGVPAPFLQMAPDCQQPQQQILHKPDASKVFSKVFSTELTLYSRFLQTCSVIFWKKLNDEILFFDFVVHKTHCLEITNSRCSASILNLFWLWPINAQRCTVMSGPLWMSVFVDCIRITNATNSDAFCLASLCKHTTTREMLNAAFSNVLTNSWVWDLSDCALLWKGTQHRTGFTLTVSRTVCRSWKSSSLGDALHNTEPMDNLVWKTPLSILGNTLPSNCGIHLLSKRRRCLHNPILANLVSQSTKWCGAYNTTGQ